MHDKFSYGYLRDYNPGSRLIFCITPQTEREIRTYTLLVFVIDSAFISPKSVKQQLLAELHKIFVLRDYLLCSLQE